MKQHHAWCQIQLPVNDSSIMRECSFVTVEIWRCRRESIKLQPHRPIPRDYGTRQSSSTPSLRIFVTETQFSFSPVWRISKYNPVDFGLLILSFTNQNTVGLSRCFTCS